MAVAPLLHALAAMAATHRVAPSDTVSTHNAFRATEGRSSVGKGRSLQSCSSEPDEIADVKLFTPYISEYPPIGFTGTQAIDVYVNVILLRIESVSPQDQEFKARMQVDMYWDSGTCSYNLRNSDICDTRYGTFYFMTARSTKNPDAETTNAQQTSQGLFTPDFPNFCVTGDFLDVSFIFQKNFNPKNYPFEVYDLKIQFDSFASTSIVRLHVLQEPPSYQFHESLPHGWYSDQGFQCTSGNVTRRNYNRGGALTGLDYSSISCSAIVYANAVEWWMSAFMFWLVSILTNFVSGLGVFSSAPSADRLQEMLQHRGTFASGAVLAYVFVVPAQPRNLPGLELATSTFVFYFGLVVLTVSALFSFFMKSLVNRQLRERTPQMRWYHYITHHEGMQGLVERAEEMKKSRRAAKRGVPNSAAQDIDKGATTVADIELVNQAAPLPSNAYPEGSELSGATCSRTTAREGELPRASQAQESDEHYRLRIAIRWQRLAMLDVFVWCLVHLTCLLGTFIVLILAAIQYSDEKSQFAQGPSVGAGSS